MAGLLGGSVVTLPAAHPQALVILRQNIDSVVMAVRPEVGRVVRKRVLAAQFVLDLDERVGHVVHLKREESAATGSVGDAIQHSCRRYGGRRP